MFNLMKSCHEEGRAIRVVEDKIMTICQCLTEEDVKQVILFYKLAERSDNV